MKTKIKKFDLIVKQVADTLKKELKEQINDVILFGSRARGDFQSESDYDILVLVTKKTKELRDKIDEIVWEIAWEHNVVITAFIYEKSRFENDRFEPLFMNIQKEGVLIR
ncbi:MAG: nucleotidyltransferase domain-containing protein [Actinobacteria bacterium]|nr:nucleotidyltransferase domain-containing protein [Actinomycetota bacterium]